MRVDREAIYRTLFETTLDGIMIVDDRGRYVEVNDSLCRLLKASREQLIGAQFGRFLPSERLSEASADFGELKSIGSFQGEFPMRALDGSVVELEWTSRANFLPGLHFCVARDITARKQAERELRRKQEELTDFIENATIGLHWVGPDGTILWANRAELEILGYTREEYLGHHIAEYHADAPVIADILRRLAAKEELHSYEARLRCKDGSIRYVLISSNVRWEDGQFVHTRCFTRDITESKRTEQALAAERKRLSVTLASIGDGVIVTDHAGCTTFLNPVAEALTGWAPDAAAGKPLPEVFRIVNETTRRPVESPVQQALRDGTIVGLANHTVLLDRDGREHAIDDSAAPIRDEAGGVLGAVLVFRDISERRRMEIATRRLAAIVESSDDAIVSKDLNGIVMSWNKAAERIFGYTAEEMIGQPIALLIPPDRPNEEPAILERLRRGERVDHYETVRVRKDGTRLDISVTISPIRDAEGHIVGASKVARDITEQKRLEREIRAQAEALLQADRAKDDFLAMLAHELRNPLAPIRNALHLLRLQGEDPGRRERISELLDRQVGHMTRMIDDLLDVSRISRGKIVLEREPLDLAQLVRLSVEDQRSALQQSGVTTVLSLPEAPVWVLGDATRLTQVLDNLLENARKFTDRGGEVRVSLAISDFGFRISESLATEAGEPRLGREADSGPTPRTSGGAGTLGRPPGETTERGLETETYETEPLTSAGYSLASPSASSSVSSPGDRPHAFGAPASVANPLPPKSEAVIAVRDTGIGIEPEMLPYLFDVFAQADRTLERSRGGLGLGLALVKGLIALHEGSVEARSAGPGQGAEFTLRLPLTAAPARASGLPAGPDREPLVRRVLLIEDNRDAAESLRQLLVLYGCEVSVAHTGPAGLELARQTRPEVIVCDIGLPGMDGYAVAVALRQAPELSGTLLLAMSGYGQEEDLRRSRHAGFDGHLVKPVDPEVLLRYFRQDD